MPERAARGDTTPRRGRTADLLSHVQADLVGCELVRGTAGTAVVTPPSGPPFEIEVRREKRRLIDLHVLAVHVHGPASDVREGTIVLHHRGQIRRTGLASRVRGGDTAAVAAVRDELMADGELERASLPLDFTSFEVRHHEDAWRATLELMGASYIRTTFPPSARYVRLDAEQLAALVATVRVLHARLPGRGSEARTEPRLPTSPARLPSSPAHLPSSPARLPWSTE